MFDEDDDDDNGKCASLIINKEKVLKTEGIKISYRNGINSLNEEDNYKFLCVSS